MKIRYILLPTVLIAFLFCSAPAYAIFNVSSTGIEEGVLGIESRNRWDEDDQGSKNGYHAHLLKMEYGFTKRFALELSNEWEDTQGEGFNFISTELEAKFRFYEPGEYWLDSAVKIAYEAAHQTGDADAIKPKLLVSKKFDKWDHTANINLSKEVGSHAEKGTEASLAWRTRYGLNKHLQPSIEYYASLGEIANMERYDGQKHRVGPVFYGEIAPGLEYRLGYLFGVSEAAEDGSLKAFLKYEFML